MKKFDLRKRASQFFLPKIRISIILSFFLLITGLQLPTSYAAQIDSSLSNFGLAGPGVMTHPGMPITATEAGCFNLDNDLVWGCRMGDGAICDVRGLSKSIEEECAYLGNFEDSNPAGDFYQA